MLTIRTAEPSRRDCFAVVSVGTVPTKIPTDPMMLKHHSYGVLVSATKLTLTLAAHSLDRRVFHCCRPVFYGQKEDPPARTFITFLRGLSARWGFGVG